MKILIVTAWYAPFIHPRAHRWATLAAQWASEGHVVQVLTARVAERAQHEILDGVQVHRVGFDSLKEWVYYWFGNHNARGRVGQKPQKQGRLGRLAAWAYQSVWKRLYFPDDAMLWFVPARKKLRQLLQTESFDVVVTVSLPFTAHLLGLFVLGRAHAPFWLADIGDPFAFQAKAPNNSFLYGGKNKSLERRVLEAAHAVTVTTAATMQLYRAQFGERAVSKMTVVPPLFKAQKEMPSIPPRQHSTQISIGYFGAMYAPTRTPDAFLNLLEQTFLLRPLLRERLEIHFYGEIFPEFFDRLSAVPNIQLHGLCTREEAWSAMQEMDILLNIGNTTDFQLPSKAVDYLASGKPIVHLSYVEQDPFSLFFANAPSFMSISIIGQWPLAEALEPWIAWLEAEKPPSDKEAIERAMDPFLAENIAREYLKLT